VRNKTNICAVYNFRKGNSVCELHETNLSGDVGNGIVLAESKPGLDTELCKLCYRLLVKE